MAGEPDGSEDTVRGMFGPDVTFLGVPRASLDALGGLDVVFVGAPYDSGTSHRPGARFGPQALRMTDYLPHDASRPHLALGVDPLVPCAALSVPDAEAVLAVLAVLELPEPQPASGSSAAIPPSRSTSTPGTMSAANISQKNPARRTAR